MELASERSGDGGSGLKEENRSDEYTVGDAEDSPHKQEIIVQVKIFILFLINIHLFKDHLFYLLYDKNIHKSFFVLFFISMHLICVSLCRSFIYLF